LPHSSHPIPVQDRCQLLLDEIYEETLKLSPKAPTGWMCLSCTNTNPDNETNCTLCFIPRVSDTLSGEWPCGVCTFLNSSANEICELCSSPKPPGLSVEPVKAAPPLKPILKKAKSVSGGWTQPSHAHYMHTTHILHAHYMLLCRTPLCYVALCCVLCCALLCCALLCAVLCFAMLRFAVCCAVLCYVALCCGLCCAVA
jgi:hypothetical protein